MRYICLNLADDTGKALVGTNKYTIHFDKGATPPVDAFWSITLYDSQGFQVGNVLNRFAVSSWMRFQTNADGSLDLYFQNESPGKDKGGQLAASAQGRLQPDHASLCAPARRSYRQVESARGEKGAVGSGDSPDRREGTSANYRLEPTRLRAAAEPGVEGPLSLAPAVPLESKSADRRYVCSGRTLMTAFGNA